MLSLLRKIFQSRLGLFALAISFGLFLSGCKAGKLKTSGLTQGSEGVTASTELNFATAGGTADSGTYRIKFTIGQNFSGTTGNTTESGIVRIRLTSTGVSREQ